MSNEDNESQTNSEDKTEQKASPPGAVNTRGGSSIAVDIFLSYSRIDAEPMQHLYNDLRTAGFTVWTDDIGLEPGTPSWQRAIEEAIQAARCMVVLLSPEAKQSQWVEIEVSFAMDLRLRVFPLLVRGDNRNSILFRLRTTQLIDARQDYQKAVIKQLIPALQRYLRGTKTPERIEPKPTEVRPSWSEQVIISGSNFLQHWREKANRSWMKPTLFGGVFLLGVLLISSFVYSQYFRGISAVATSPQTGLVTGSAPLKKTLTGNTVVPTKQATVMSTTPTPVPTHTLVPLTATSMPTPLLVPTATSSLATITPASTIIPVLQPMATRLTSKDSAVYVWIPPGAFMMGGVITDTLAHVDEVPAHKVFVNGFWIMQFEVTNAQYKLCVEENICTQPYNQRWNDSAYANHPVTNVNWEQAQTYAKWVNGRLPTEAEWEKACRGTDGRLYPWGNQLPNPELLNYVGTNKSDTMPVGSYPPGINTLYDMAGNVWEWTADWYEKTYYDNSPPSNPQGADNGTYHTIRGGSSYYGDDYVRCAARGWYLPIAPDVNIGFRVVSPDF